MKETAMIRRLVYILVLLMTVVTPLVAQDLPSGDPRNDTFRQHFVEVMKLNPRIINPNKMPVGSEYELPDGSLEYLSSDDHNGIWGKEFQKTYGFPYEDFLKGTPVPVQTTDNVYTENRQASLTPVVATQTDWFSLFVGAIVGILVVFAVWRITKMRNQEARERELRQDPVTSGPPIVAGGIPAADTRRLDAHYHDRAVNQYVSTHPGTDAQVARRSITRIGPIEEGMVSGDGMVDYNDHPRPRRIDPAQPGYRARFRFPDGSEQELISLQGCMNPCYFGEGMTGFTFTPRQVVVPVPEPPAPAPVAVPNPAFAVTRIKTAAEGDGVSTITIGDQVMTLPRGAHLTVNEETGEVKIDGGAFSLIVDRKRKAKGAKPKVARRTGTNN